MSEIQKAAIWTTFVGGVGTFISPMVFVTGRSFGSAINSRGRLVLAGGLMTTALGTILFAVDYSKQPSHKNEYRAALKTSGIVAIGFGIGEIGFGVLYPSFSMTTVGVGLAFAGAGLGAILIADDVAKVVKWSN